MRRLLSIILPVSLLAVASCTREPVVETGPALVFGEVPVTIGGESDEPGTRSLLSVNSESFRDAYLFAFDASTKKVLSYPEHAGDLEGAGPVAMKVTSKTFNWALPFNKAMDIWVVVNAGGYASVLDGFLTDADLTESDLYGDALVFTCSGSDELLALETSGSGIPMSGMMNGVTLTSAGQGVDVKVKRLFAKYSVKVNTSALTELGYTVSSTYVKSSKANTEVPFFYNGGFGQSDESKLATVDHSAGSDLSTLDGGGAVTLYFLENCQGDKSGALRWDTVEADLGSDAVRLCSYMEIGVNAVRDVDGTNRSFAYKVYLGKTDMMTNFDVQRNYSKTIKLSVKPYGLNNPSIGFVFTHASTLSAAPGESITIPYETSLENEELAFSSDKAGVHVTGRMYNGTNNVNLTPMPHCGHINLTVDEGTLPGVCTLKGGSSLLYDTIYIEVTGS